AQTDALIREGEMLSAKHSAEITRQMTPSPLALAAGVLPNAASAALMAPESARRGVAMSKLKAEDEKYNARLGRHMAANTAEVGQLIDANPRLPRLSQLAIKQNCELPQE
ncbi:MAG: hypothetical protein M3R16_13155, partial [Pseudomonadota bacterium]|nr:hypothetical protein [Pseudomonadota bacterium]